MKSRSWLLAGAMSLIPALGVEASVGPAQVMDQARFAPPVESLVVSRTVIRELSDGHQIRVTRDYLVRFQNDGIGYLVSGTLVNVAVDVPPLLKGLGELERTRSDEGVFPLHLDGQGRIRSGDGAGSVDPALGREISRAAGAFVQQNVAAVNQRQLHTGFVEQAVAHRARSPWPSDLFCVPAGEHRQSKDIALANGEQGRIEILTRVDPWSGRNLPQKIEKTTTTIVAGTRQVSREIWTLRPETAPIR